MGFDVGGVTGVTGLALAFKAELQPGTVSTHRNTILKKRLGLPTSRTSSARTPFAAAECSPSPPWRLWLFPLECQEQFQLLNRKHTCPLWTEAICTRRQFSPEIVRCLGTSFFTSFELSVWATSDYGGSRKEKKEEEKKREGLVRELSAQGSLLPSRRTRVRFPGPTG